MTQGTMQTIYEAEIKKITEKLEEIFAEAERLEKEAFVESRLEQEAINKFISKMSSKEKEAIRLKAEEEFQKNKEIEKARQKQEQADEARRAYRAKVAELNLFFMEQQAKQIEKFPWQVVLTVVSIIAVVLILTL